MEESPSPQLVQVAGRTDSSADPAIARQAITAFANERFGAARPETPDENVTRCSTARRSMFH